MSIRGPHESESHGYSVKWNHGTHDEFYEYYAKASESQNAMHRFRSIRDTIIRMNPHLVQDKKCGVADIGCGAGTQSILWAQLGFKVHGVDVNERLLALAHERAAKAGCQIDFVLGSAVALPWPDEYVDVCLAVELLEHVKDWEQCLREFCRILRPGGVLFVSTTNALCPIQQEFNLPLYSWYPSAVKRYCATLAKTTRPQLANYATYPAENWFTFYQLRAFLKERGFESLDRFDLVDAANKGTVAKVLLGSVRAFAPLRWLAHLATPGTSLLGLKNT